MLDEARWSGKFRGSRVLVTGGAGFIGSRVAARLVAAGARVTVIDSMGPDYGGNPHNLAALRDDLEFSVTDLRDSHALDWLVRGQEYVFNLAGQTSHVGSMEDPVADMDVNVRGQLNLLEACRRHNRDARIVFASTRQLYGVPDYLPVDEQHPIRPPDANAVSKHAAEGYHLVFSEKFGLASTVLRLTNTYGPGMRIRDARQTFVGIWIRLALEGKPFAVFGDGLVRRDFNYVEDVVDAFLLSATSAAARGRIFNLGGVESPTLEELALKLVALVPGAAYDKMPLPANRMSIDIGSCYSSFARIESELGWRPSVLLDEGLAATLAYYRENFRHYV